MADGLLDGGVITVEWSASTSAELTITGPGSILLNGSAATFPYTLTDTKSFDVTRNGTFTVTVTHHGVEIMSKSVFIRDAAEHRLVPDISMNTETWGQINAALDNGGGSTDPHPFIL